MAAVNASVGPREQLLTRKQELQYLIACIRDVLEELADAEADAACPIPCTSTEASSEGIAALLYRLRAELLRNQVVPTAEQLLLFSAQDHPSEVSQLPSEQGLLLTTLDEIIEIAFSSGRPVSGWYDVESRFSRFVVSFQVLFDSDGDCLGDLPARRKTVFRATADAESPRKLAVE